MAVVLFLLFSLKTLLWLFDDTMRLYLGDSAAYLYGAMDDGKLPDDRSFTYSFIIRGLVYPFDDLRLLGQWQSAAGVAVACLLYHTLRRRFDVSRWPALIAAGLLAVEPSQLYYERMVLAETFGLLAFATFFAACAAYLASGRVWWLPLMVVSGLAAATLRLNYLPVVLVMSIVLPLLRVIDSTARTPSIVRHALVAALSVAVLHGTYCYWVGQIFSSPPGYLGRAGFMQLGLVLPLVRPHHLAEVGLEPNLQDRLAYPMSDPHARMPHLWAPGGLISELRARKLDVDRLSRRLSRRAVADDPLGIVRVGWVTLSDYFNGEGIQHALDNDLGRRKIPDDILWSLREQWGYDATGLDTRVTIVSRLFEVGTPWLVVCLLFLPIAAVVTPAVYWARPQRLQAVLVALFSVGLFAAHLLFVPVAFYRYMHPLPFFVILNLVLIGNAALRVRRFNASTTSSTSPRPDTADRR